MTENKHLKGIFVLLVYSSFLFFVESVYDEGHHRDSNPYRHKQVVDTEGKYVLEWEVDWGSPGGACLIFNVTVKTRGWIGLGLSKKGLMNGADIVVGGVGRNGKPYFSDRHGVGQSRPVRDNSQDWKLLSAWESQSHTFLSFSRPLDTCDETGDLPITNDLLNFIWAYGETDDENVYHHQHRGFFDSYILDPDLTPRIVAEQRWKNVTNVEEFHKLGDWKVWRLNIPQVMPPQDTAYICTVHKAPTRTKHHIVGFRPVLPTALEHRHLHHIVIYKCYPPLGTNPNILYAEHVGRQGEECYIFTEPEKIPAQYCREIRYEWAIGGGPAFFPEHVGFAMSETSDEYYVVQVHYDNPESLPNLLIDLSIEIYYTDKLREYEGGIINAGARRGSSSILIPPHSLDHLIYGFCAAECTRQRFPTGGINVFSVRAHTHLAGTRNRMIIIRDSDKNEVPIYVDENYNFNFQEYRTLKEEISVKPGDTLYHRCNLQTTTISNSAVGGFSTREEMCHGWLFYYPYVRDFGYCQSEIRSDIYRDFLQIHNTTFSKERREFMVTAPSTNAGLSTQEATTRINWTIDKRRQLQNYQKLLPQVTVCDKLDPDTSDRLVAEGRASATLPRHLISTPFLTQRRPKSFYNKIYFDKEKGLSGSEFVNLLQPTENIMLDMTRSICPKQL